MYHFPLIKYKWAENEASDWTLACKIYWVFTWIKGLCFYIHRHGLHISCLFLWPLSHIHSALSPPALLSTLFLLSFLWDVSIMKANGAFLSRRSHPSSTCVICISLSLFLYQNTFLNMKSVCSTWFYVTPRVVLLFGKVISSPGGTKPSIWRGSLLPLLRHSTQVCH